MDMPLSKAKMDAFLYLLNWALIMPSSVDLPAPVGPKIKVCPISPVCRFNLKGVEPSVAQYIRAGELAGNSGEGLNSLPGQIVASGSISERFIELMIGLGRLHMRCRDEFQAMPQEH